MSATEIKQIVQWGIKSGKIHPPILPLKGVTQTGEPRKIKKTNYGTLDSRSQEYANRYQRERRASLVAQGLTMRGTKRKRNK